MNKKVVFEDVEMQYNRWVQGIASREQAASKLTLSDLFDRQNKQSPNDYKEKVYIPQSLTTISNILGSIVVGNSNLKDKLKQTWDSPYCKESEHRKKMTKRLYKQTKIIDKIIKNIIDGLDNLVDNKELSNKIKENEINS